MRKRPKRRRRHLPNPDGSEEEVGGNEDGDTELPPCEEDIFNSCDEDSGGNEDNGESQELPPCDEDIFNSCEEDSGSGQELPCEDDLFNPCEDTSTDDTGDACTSPNEFGCDGEGTPTECVGTQEQCAGVGGRHSNGRRWNPRERRR